MSIEGSTKPPLNQNGPWCQARPCRSDRGTQSMERVSIPAMPALPLDGEGIRNCLSVRRWGKGFGELLGPDGRLPDAGNFEH
jgi:hypothetical protein